VLAGDCGSRRRLQLDFNISQPIPACHAGPSSRTSLRNRVPRGQLRQLRHPLRPLLRRWARRLPWCAASPPPPPALGLGVSRGSAAAPPQLLAAPSAGVKPCDRADACCRRHDDCVGSGGCPGTALPGWVAWLLQSQLLRSVGQQPPLAQHPASRSSAALPSRRPHLQPAFRLAPCLPVQAACWTTSATRTS
jgi:hypothetical protein